MVKCRCKELELLVKELGQKGVSRKEITEFAESTNLDLCEYRGDAKLADYTHRLVFGFFGVGAGIAASNILQSLGTPDNLNYALASMLGVSLGFGLHHLIYSKRKCEQNNKFYDIVKKRYYKSLA